MSYYYLQTSNDYLAHHGVLGMKWGIRRYQPYQKGSKGGKEVGEAAEKSKDANKDDEVAKKRYVNNKSENEKKVNNALNKVNNRKASELTPKEQALMAGITAMSISLGVALMGAMDSKFYESIL